MTITETLEKLRSQADWWQKKATEFRASADVEKLSRNAEGEREAEKRARFCDLQTLTCEQAIAHLTSRAKRAGFVPPTGAEVKAYFAEIGVKVNEAQKFLAHYEANGWRVGKNPMKDWRAAARSWKLRVAEDNPAAIVQTVTSVDPEGWAEWLQKSLVPFKPYQYAPQFLRDEFNRSRK